MSEPFLGKIVAFGFSFNPRGWAKCDGQLLPINQNQSLYSLLGTTYGGDGRTTFALPDLRGRASIGMGNGPGLTPRTQGSKGGSETNTLSVDNLPAHGHSFAPPSNSGAGNTDSATGSFPAQTAEDNYNSASNSAMGAGDTTNAGGGQAVNNMQPFLTVNYCIALQGLFPSRN